MQEESRKDKILRRVQALLAKANSTPFSGEADVFRAKADELMTMYAIEEWELAKQSSSGSLKPIRKQVDLSWWYSERHALASALWSLFLECSRHCRVVVASSKVDSGTKTIPCFGLESDIDYLQLLFTDLYVQMSGKIKPQYDPDKSLGENVYRAKEAGMKYGDIAKWAGHPEWIKLKGYSKRGYPQYEYNGIMIREMKKFAAASGLPIHQSINLDAYIEDYCLAFAHAVNKRLKAMRDDQGQSGESMALVLRDITDLAREAMYETFEDLRPHQATCDCDKCHVLKCHDNNCSRKVCVERRKPVKHSKTRYRNYNYAAAAMGGKAGSEARIAGKGDNALRGRKSLSS